LIHKIQSDYGLQNRGFTPSDKVLEINNGEVSNLSGNLPNVPVNAIVYQKNSPDRLFIGLILACSIQIIVLHIGKIWGRYAKCSY